ncbi:MAG: hypothetical protein KDC43_22285 [Saprospiraceae bacterium]|nr:hypothetical protein [Saprospiraceae bacterium]MCB0626568.1 hypothetical protein [Saprospiraceae bacterium]MCB0675379.1 hypothetical protein [Saprospiraceae bacterium]MCB0680306.1 hypothetical protein [Saprospiraceae bacterium]
MTERPKKRIISRIELAFLIIGLLIIAYIVTAQGNCAMLKRTEKLEWVE